LLLHGLPPGRAYRAVLYVVSWARTARRRLGTKMDFEAEVSSRVAASTPVRRTNGKSAKNGFRAWGEGVKRNPFRRRRPTTPGRVSEKSRCVSITTALRAHAPARYKRR